MEILQQQPARASPISAMFSWPFSIQLSGMKMLYLQVFMFFCCLLTLTPAQLPENVPRNLETGKLQPYCYWKDKPSKAEKVQDLNSNSTLEAHSLYLHKFMEQSFITARFDALKNVETPSTTIIGKLMGRAESNLQEFLEPVTKHMILLHVTITMPAKVKAEKDEKNKIHLDLGSCVTEDNSLNITIT
ncbi:uncharacterized protein LOC118841136 isoform X2 [Trichosurus vulpecula]|uniref:uncharacterized protein LOC118841136 isoform X2 n=1 Tax=Trichosurus vulpecula TaxID=9337 RepID=UPI00186B1829|nr:uncharacterized protein LOC118841136 isoform X2 [Trichosurus vulpecula]